MLRILLVHNRYRQRGGEDAVFEAEKALLAASKHPVRTLEWDSKEIPASLSVARAAKLALDTIWSRDAARRVAAAVRQHRAQVVHFHNTFPLVSPSAIRSAWRAGASTVYRLPNYRLLCLNAELYRDGHICHDCVGRTIPWPGVVHRCRRQSVTASSVMGAMVVAHRAVGTWRRYVDLFVTPSQAARSEYTAAGFDPESIAVKPNFTAIDPQSRAGRTRGGGVLFVGRLVQYKGILTLLRAWELLREDIRLRVIGDGPLAAAVRAAAAADRRIEYHGGADPREVINMMSSADVLVFPSEVLETFGMTIVEAFAARLPVIASAVGASVELIEDRRTGLLFQPGDAPALASAIRWAARNPGAMAEIAKAAEQTYLDRYTPSVNYELLMGIYRRAIENHRSARVHRS